MAQFDFHRSLSNYIEDSFSVLLTIVMIIIILPVVVFLAPFWLISKIMRYTERLT